MGPSGGQDRIGVTLENVGSIPFVGLLSGITVFPQDRGESFDFQYPATLATDLLLIPFPSSLLPRAPVLVGVVLCSRSVSQPRLSAPSAQHVPDRHLVLLCISIISYSAFEIPMNIIAALLYSLLSRSHPPDRQMRCARRADFLFVRPVNLAVGMQSSTQIFLAFAATIFCVRPVSKLSASLRSSSSARACPASLSRGIHRHLLRLLVQRPRLLRHPRLDLDRDVDPMLRPREPLGPRLVRLFVFTIDFAQILTFNASRLANFAWVRTLLGC